MLCHSVHLFSFFWCLVAYPVNHSHIQYHEAFPLRFFEFIVSGVTLRSLIHFGFIFAYGIRERSNFIYFACGHQVSQHHFFLSSLNERFWHHCWKSFDHVKIYFWLYSTSLVSSTSPVSKPIPHYFYYCSFVISSEVKKKWDLQLCFSFSR